MVKLEVGKYYKTRDGRKVGPMLETVPWKYRKDYTHIAEGGGAYCADGRYYDTGLKSDYDIVSKWVDYSSCTAAQVDVQRDEYGPIRTHREIVPGVYGVVTVDRDNNGTFAHVECAATAEELREAAHLFNQLAEVLDDNRA